ncbi:MAG TPA: hypothetical protein PKK96_15700 [Anaerolineales bacterium]|nr:hypothetical protein [Anaerolineales bacterium]HNQ94975.1 hypothetical protein [Anaerolineales bacterium]HNS62445.1 hypothetical protein [Anaerolineales bacterium]
MEAIVCGGGVLLIVVLIVFFYLLNTARKRVTETTSLGKKQLLPVYISLADKPTSIIQGMNKLRFDVNKTEKAGDKWRWIPMFIFLAGVGLALIDGILLLLGYFSFVFTGGGVALWIAAIVMARGLRKSDSYDLSIRYNGTRDILYTLRDDLRPDSTYLGHLDLTGSLLPTKVARSANDAQGRTTEYFRDEWLALKAKLYDGSILRVSGIQKSKKRKSYWKRSRISGKMKSKPEKFKGTAHDLKVRIVPNPEVYKIAKTSAEFKQGLNIGKFTISQLSTEGGMVSFVANSPFEEVEHENILQVLKSAYTLLQRKAA